MSAPATAPYAPTEIEVHHRAALDFFGWAVYIPYMTSKPKPETETINGMTPMISTLYDIEQEAKARYTTTVHKLALAASLYLQGELSKDMLTVYVESYKGAEKAYSSATRALKKACRNQD